MNNKIGFNRLGRKPSHRNAMHRNMVTSLFKYERITTTKAKAKEVRRSAEKMVTRAKDDTVHNRRIISKDIQDKAILAKLFTDISPRFKDRNGGYTRILKLGRRNNDAAEMVLLELVEKSDEKGKKKAEKKAEKAAKAEKKSDKAGKTEKVEEKADKAEVKEEEKAEEPKEEKPEEEV
jgi:large subunit ribosomal protein L17